MEQNVQDSFKYFICTGREREEINILRGHIIIIIDASLTLPMPACMPVRAVV
jgi:hypothetical protein